jgi:hypothetical protein
MDRRTDAWPVIRLHTFFAMGDASNFHGNSIETALARQAISALEATKWKT